MFDPERADGNLMEIKHIRIRNYESDLFMYLNYSCSVYHQCLSTDDQISVQIIIYIINYKTRLPLMKQKYIIIYCKI